MEAPHLNQIELAARWRVSHRTLERWRWTGEGPRFVKLGGRVVYRLSDIKEYEYGSRLTGDSRFGQAQRRPLAASSAGCRLCGGG